LTDDAQTMLSAVTRRGDKDKEGLVSNSFVRKVLLKALERRSTPPRRHWHAAKVLFEKDWLRKWF